MDPERSIDDQSINDQTPETFVAPPTGEPDIKAEVEEPEIAMDDLDHKESKGVMFDIAHNKFLVKAVLTAGLLLSGLGGIKAEAAGGNKAVERIRLIEGINQHVVVSFLRHFMPESVKKTADGREMIEGEVPLDANLARYSLESETNRRNLDQDHRQEAQKDWETLRNDMAKDPQMKEVLKTVTPVAQDFLGSAKEPPRVAEGTSFRNASVGNLVDRVKGTLLKINDLLKGKKEATPTMMKVEESLIEIAAHESLDVARHSDLSGETDSEVASTED